MHSDPGFANAVSATHGATHFLNLLIFSGLANSCNLSKIHFHKEK
jgi:hypothetical protein